MRPLAALCLLCTALTAGCGSSQDADRDWTRVPPMDTTLSTRSTTFETRTDTVNADGGQARAHTDAVVPGSSIVKFTVQIGSFADAKNAAIAQAEARQRYQLPVVNDYNTQRKRYQIRIGFFETEEAAAAFCTKLKSDFPQEYKGAWVTQINK